MSHLRVVVDALPPSLRTAIYAAFEGLGYALTAAEAGVLATGHHWMPLTVTLAVYASLSGRVHALARANVPKR